MKALFILGSPRKNGNTEILLRSVMEGAERAGGEVEMVRLADLKISPCIACGGCEKTGRCVIMDDMQQLYEKIDAADRIVIASPIYFYGVTALTKAFVDRSQALWSRKYLLKQRVRPGVTRKGYYVGVCATRGEKIFSGAILTVKYALDAMDFAYGGEFLVRGVDKKGAIRQKKEELAGALEFGRSVIVND